MPDAAVVTAPGVASPSRLWVKPDRAQPLLLGAVAATLLIDALLVAWRGWHPAPAALVAAALASIAVAAIGSGATRSAAGFAALVLALRFFLRSNPPPLGIIAFGGVIGLLYALVAFGLILIHRANRVISFAQGQIGAVPAIFAILLVKLHHWPYLLGFVVAVVAAAAEGVVVERLVIRRFFNAPRLVVAVATIGIALALAVVQFFVPRWVGGAHVKIDPTPPRTPFSGLHFTIHPVLFDGNAIVILIVAALVVVGLTAFFRFTDVGLSIRAAAENADRAILLGLSPKRLSTYAWMLAAVLSSIGIFLRVPVIGVPVGADISPQVLVYALAAAVVARMERFGVALAAGVAIGMVDQSLYFFSRDPSVASALMLPVLLGALLLQRRRTARGEDTGLASWRQASEFRPVPPELAGRPEVQWVRAGMAVVLAVALGVLPYVTRIDQQILASVIVIYAIVAVSLVALTGWAGQISLGQWGIAGIGAMVAGGLASHLRADFFLTLLAAGLAGAVVAVVIGLPALRIQGLYLAVATLAFGLAVPVYLLSPTYFPRLLPDQLHPIVRPLLYGKYSIDGPRAYYFLCLAFLALALLSMRALRNSRTGRVLIAARDNVRGAQAFGVPVARARLAAFAISGFWAALAGALFAYHQQALDPGSFPPDVSLLLLIVVVIGGVTSLPGAMLGVAYIGVLKYGGFSSQVQGLASGLGVLFLLAVLPGGLAQALYGGRDAGLRWLAQRRGIDVPSLVADDGGHRPAHATPPALPIAPGLGGATLAGPEPAAASGAAA